MSIKRKKDEPGQGLDLPEDKPKFIIPDTKIIENESEEGTLKTQTEPDRSDSGGSGKTGLGSGGAGGSSGPGSGKTSGTGGGKAKKDEKPNPFIEARQFLKEVIIEFRKISWPEPQQVVRETWSVLFLVAVITLMVLGFDWVLANMVFNPLEHFARLHGGGIGSR